MGKYDDLIGGGTISTDDVLEKQERESNTRKKLTKQLIELVEDDINERKKEIFYNEDWAKADNIYLGHFLKDLKKYLQWLQDPADVYKNYDIEIIRRLIEADEGFKEFILAYMDLTPEKQLALQDAVKQNATENLI